MMECLMLWIRYTWLLDKILFTPFSCSSCSQCMDTYTLSLEPRQLVKGLQRIYCVLLYFLKCKNRFVLLDTPEKQKRHSYSGNLLVQLAC